MESAKIRETFLEFFRSKEHTIVPSAPMVVKNDPTLMFTNAGMNQFKDIFLGNSPIKFKRIADTQKCLRVSGKHNDLEEVGHDTYHHTMFEMLGNWSFGDYFKKEAIRWAWELLTDVLGMDKSRIYVTVFEGDTTDGVPFDSEAYDYWKELLPEGQILKGNKKDNFWEMGDTGPCGPCSEIHYDLRDQHEIDEVSGRELVNSGHWLVIEIWNLVFMQYNRKADGSLEPLKHKHIDTGMGFERLCMVLQGKKSNYDTDVFQPIIVKISQMCGKKYGEDQKSDIAMRVITDHLRAITFSIADGQLPSNVKAGYVIRRILRRAVRYGYTYLGFSEPFINKLVDTLTEQMGPYFPELIAQNGLIKSVIAEEEASFLRTLSTGINLLENIILRSFKEGRTEVSGKDAFTLYDTYGFPIDLTELISKEHDMGVDIVSFESELKAQKDRSRNAAAIEAGDWIEVNPVAESQFVGYDTLQETVKIARYRKVSTKGNEFFQIVLDKTPFYGNSGGQVGDSGYLQNESERIAITDTVKDNNLTVHIAPAIPEEIDGEFLAVVDRERRNSSANNHTATHLLHEALRLVLGSHVQQKGSLVNPDYLRFDFSHFQKVDPVELREVERIVNSRIRANYPLDENRECSIDEARKQGAMMLFGEKYGDVVRTVRFGSSVELCGGTHASHTGNIGYFRIISESAISAGVRRIEAVTGEKAEEMVYLLQDTVQGIQQIVNSPAVMQAVKKLFEDNTELHRKVEQMVKEKVSRFADKMINEYSQQSAVGGVIVDAREIDFSGDYIRDIGFALRARLSNLALVMGAKGEDKVSLAVILGDDVVSKGLNAATIVKEAAREIQGGGGGQPFFAMAGGKDPSGLERAMEIAKQLINDKIKS